MAVTDGIAAYLSNLGESASMGLTKYPAALAIQGTRALTGGAPLTWDEAVHEARLQQNAANAASPTAATLGNLSGNVVNAALVGGAGIPQLVARNAATGAVRGFTQNEGLDDAALDTLGGATLGAAGGLVGGATDAALRGLTRGQLSGGVSARKEELERRFLELTTRRDALRALQPKTKVETKQVQDAIKRVNDSINGLQGIRAKFDADVKLVASRTPAGDARARDIASWHIHSNPTGLQLANSPLLRSTAVGGAGGATLGALYGVATGNDPLQSAAYGAVGGGSLGSIGTRAALSAVNTGARGLGKVGVTPGVATQLATAAGVPVAVGNRTPQNTVQPTSEAEELFNRGEDAAALFDTTGED